MSDKDLSKPVAWQWFYYQQWHVTNDEERARDVAWGNVKVSGLYDEKYVQSLLARIAELEREKSYATFQPIAARDVLKERLRQIKEESWTPEHDDQHSNGELSFAAISYLMAVVNPNASHGWWPWDVKSWNPSSDFRHNLVRAGALIIAEIDRLDRTSGTLQGDE